ncbi:MAG: DUF3179 domain-containing protein [Candidatus Kariarchaeaceae archaeon]|jgi:hypothetical protein
MKGNQQLLLILFLLLISVPTNNQARIQYPVYDKYIDPTNESLHGDGTSSDKLTPDQTCAVPCGDIVQGQVKDGIPSVDSPIFLKAGDAGAPPIDSKVIGVVVDGIARAYSYDILNWHEIVNDEINGNHFSVTYCPLTGTGILYHTEVLENADLGTSGYLYENNLVFYDRISDSMWSQMEGLSVRGEKVGDEIEFSSAIETTWGAWKKMHPDTVVLSEDTGFLRDYQRYPYGSYRTSESVLFRTTFNPNIEPYSLFHHKALTVVMKSAEGTKLLPFEVLADVPVLNHDFNDQPVVTVFDEEYDLAVTFSSVLENGSSLIFGEINGGSYDHAGSLDLRVFADSSGSLWNLNGESFFGAYSGQKLTQVPTYNAFWFAASTFYHNASILLGAELAWENNTRVYVENDVTSFAVDPAVQDTGFLNFTTEYLVLFVILGTSFISRRKLTRK